jgi:hypothetical protein
MPESQKGDQSKRARTSQVSDPEMMGELAEAIVESLKNSSQEDCDPFEHYAHELRLRLHVDVKLFRDRFIQGYEALLETLQSMSKQ